MAVENRVAGRAVAVARAVAVPPAALSVSIVLQPAIIDAIGEALLRTDCLTVEIGAAAGVVAREPLMRVEVKDMRLFRPRVEVSAR